VIDHIAEITALTAKVAASEEGRKAAKRDCKVWNADFVMENERKPEPKDKADVQCWLQLSMTTKEISDAHEELKALQKAQEAASAIDPASAVVVAVSEPASPEPSAPEAAAPGPASTLVEVDPQQEEAAREHLKLLALYQCLSSSSKAGEFVSHWDTIPQLLEAFRSVSFTPRVCELFFGQTPGQLEFAATVGGLLGAVADGFSKSAGLGEGDESSLRAISLLQLLMYYCDHLPEIDGLRREGDEAKALGLVKVNKRQAALVAQKVVPESLALILVNCKESHSVLLEIVANAMTKLCIATPEEIMFEEGSANMNSSASPPSLARKKEKERKSVCLCKEAQDAFIPHAALIAGLPQVLAMNATNTAFASACEIITVLSEDNADVKSALLDADVAKYLFEQLERFPENYDGVSVSGANAHEDGSGPSHVNVSDNACDYHRMVNHKVACLRALGNVVRPKEHRNSEGIAMKVVREVMRIRDLEEGVEHGSCKAAAHKASMKIMSQVTNIEDKKKAAETP